MAQGYKCEDMPFWELCNIIYAGFGQYAVTNFINDRKKEGYLQDIVFGLCEPCEDEAPFENESCLICGARRNNDNA